MTRDEIQEIIYQLRVEDFEKAKQALNIGSALENLLESPGLNFEAQSQTLVVSVGALRDHNKRHYQLLLERPIAWTQYVRMEWYAVHQVQVRSIDIKKLNSGKDTPLDRISNDDLEHLVHVKGIVKRITSLAISVKSTRYRCGRCGATEKKYYRWFDGFSRRLDCGCTRSSHKIEDKTERKYADYQLASLTVLPDSQTDNNDIDCKAELEILISTKAHFNALKPGNRVSLLGVIMPRETIEAKIDSYMELLCFTHLDKQRAKTYSVEKIEEYQEFAKNNPLEVLKKYFFEDIYGHDHVKDALILQQFSGGRGRPAKRDNIHILLAGDPSVGKSKILKNVYQKVSGVYTTGIGASAVGLTATVYRELDGRWTIDGGALVLANGRTVFVDELDKMNLTDTSGLLEAMEQQTVSISKANISMTLPTKFSLLAAANPRYTNVFRTDEAPYTQLKLPAPLLSRFDLIFVLKSVKENSLANRLLLQKLVDDVPELTVQLPVDLNEYIGYAKTFNPVLSPEIKKNLIDIFSASKVRADKKQIPLNIRQLEGLVRLVKARARLYLRSVVTSEDVLVCKTLFERSIHELCGYTDESVNVVDESIMVAWGNSAKDQKLLNAIVSVLAGAKDGLSQQTLLLKVMSLIPSVTKRQYLKVLNQLSYEGRLYKPDGLKYRLSQEWV